ncbi:MAG TPA: HAD-IA family hydrolase [Stellaceae bacterium]|nr:HAD-IA family hydrolase [Stellaceae bacterium]
MPAPRFRAIAFDLLTALVDSWSLWIDVAGQEELGRRWRSTSLRIVTSTGTYQPYELIVRQAAVEVSLPPDRANALLSRWGELRPWPEAPDVLRRVQGRRLAVVTNCSQRLAELAASATGGHFEVIMSAERAGVYKTDPRAYLAAVTALGLTPEEILFVAGSAHDVPGAGQVGMKVYWSNRQRLPVPDGAPMPLVDASDLSRLPELLEQLG